MTPVAFIADTPDTITLSGGVARSRVQIAKTGKFKDPRYGSFSITTANFDAWERNFRELSKADGRLGLPVDVDHAPEKKGETEAAGWVIELDRLGKDGKTSTPNELWATVEWNTLGQELVGDRRYVYLSPSYQHDFKDEQGRSHGTALVGVALTNRPFLTMATVSLSVALAVEEVESYSHRQMPELIDTLRETLGLSADADEATVLSTVAAVKQKSETPAPPHTPGDVNLDSLAASQGKVVLSAADHLKLAADAAAGAAAAQELKTSKFDNAFTLAVSDGRVLPAMKDIFLASYNADSDATLAKLAELPKVLSTVPAGHTGDGEGEAQMVDSTTLSEAKAEDWAVDSDRAALHAKALSIATEQNIDYGEAIHLAMGA